MQATSAVATSTPKMPAPITPAHVGQGLSRRPLHSDIMWQETTSTGEQKIHDIRPLLTESFGACVPLSAYLLDS